MVRLHLIRHYSWSQKNEFYPALGKYNNHYLSHSKLAWNIKTTAFEEILFKRTFTFFA